MATTDEGMALITEIEARDSSGGAIREQLDSLTEQLGKLDAQLSMLEDRIDPVLGPSYPTETDGNVAKDKPSMSAVLDSLIGLHAFTRRLQSKVEHITSRVEV